MLTAACWKIAGQHLPFAPSVEEMYPQPDTREFSYAPLDTVMEGAFRPGHFSGVARLSASCLTRCNPDRAYFGERFPATGDYSGNGSSDGL